MAKIFVGTTLDDHIELLEAIEDKAKKYSCTLDYYSYDDAREQHEEMNRSIAECDFAIFIDTDSPVPIFAESKSLILIQLSEFIRTRKFTNDQGMRDEKTRNLLQISQS